MLVEKEQIEKAKEKLGDKNAFIMADLLELDKFDEKNLKACCPYHDEDTASFIYDKKRMRYKCFGCGKYVDIIDVQMEKGNTFLESVQYLFEEANIEYSFGEKNVKTRMDYKYPKEEPLNDKPRVLEYLNKRGISCDVIDYLDIREDINGNIVFNFYDTNDVLTMVKYRPSHTVDKKSGMPKTWCQKGADTTPLLFNMNRVNTSSPLLICEGEVDCASAIQAGYTNTVSVPLGAGNLHWIEENWDWLEQFSEIIIWSDNDDPGEKMRKDCTYRLGTWRTKYIVTPAYYTRDNGSRVRLKDVNDCLQTGGASFVMSLINNAKDVPISSVVNYSELQELDMSEMEGVKTGIKPLDDTLNRLYYGTVTILSGRPGSGKTSIIDQIAANAMDDGVPVFMFSRELVASLSAAWMNFILAGNRNLEKRESRDGRPYYVVPKCTQKKIQSYYDNKLFVYKDSEPNDVDSIMTSLEECVRKYGVKFAILDNLMTIDLGCKEQEKNTAQTELMNRLTRFAGKYNIAIVMICHPRKTQDSNSDIEMYDISGTSNLINLCVRSIGLRRTSKKEKDDVRSKWGDYDVVCTVIKDRLFGKTDVQIGLWYDLYSRRFYTNYEELDHQYKWDDRVYTLKIPYEDRRRQKDEFPDR